MIKRWTSEEDAFLIKNYGNIGSKEIGEELGRSIASVEGRVGRLRAKGIELICERLWKEEEEQSFIEDYVQKVPMEEMIEKYGRSASSLTAKAAMLRKAGFKVSRELKWTKEQNKLLVEIYGSATQEELENAFNRKYEAIITQAARLNKSRSEEEKIRRPELVKAWVEWEEKLIVEKYASMSVQEIADTLGRTSAAVQARIQVLRGMGFKEELQGRMWWSEEEKQFIRDNYNSMSNIEIGNKLGRPHVYVTEIAKELGLKSKVFKWTPEVIKEMKSKWNTQSTKSIARSLGVTEKRLLKRANELGLTRLSDTADGTYTVTEVGKLIGMSSQSVRNMIIDGKLKAKKIQYGGQSVYRMEILDIKEFMRNHTRSYDLAKGDLYSVKLLIADTNSSGNIVGLPEWLKEKINKDMNPKRKLYARRAWTIRELKTAQRLKMRGLTHGKIGEYLGRSPDGVGTMFLSGRYDHLLRV